MSKQIVKNYAFNATAKTVTLTDFSVGQPVRLERLALITDVTTNQILYNFADTTVATAAISSNNVITLSAVPGGVANADNLRIDYDVITGDPTYDSVATGSGQAVSVVSSGNTATVNSQGSINVALQGLAGVAVPLRPDSYLKVANDPSPLIADVFDAALDTVNRWTASGTVIPTSANGTLTVSTGTAALATSWLVSQPTFPLQGNMFLQTVDLIQTDSALKTGAYRFVGFGVAAGSPTVSAPITNGVGFEWIDTTGVLSGVVWSGGSRTQTVSLSSVQPLDTSFHRYVVYYKTSRAYFEIDGVQVGSIAYPNPQVSTLPRLMLNVNGASTVSPAAVFTSSFLGVGDSGRNSTELSDGTYPWRKTSVSKDGGLQISGTQTAVSSTAWTSATAVNTANTIDVTGYNTVSVGMTNTATMTAGVLTFEVSPDGGTNWFALSLARIDSYTVETTYTLSVVANRAWSTSVDGFTKFRVRLSTVITGTGTATVFITPQTFAIEPIVSVGQATAANLNATVTGTVSIGNTANTTAILANPLPPVVSTTGDTGAKLATFNGATLTNTTSKGATVILHLGAVTGTTPTLVMKLQASADGGTTWVDLPGATTATITATGDYGIQIYPGLVAVAAVATTATTAQISGLLPKTWRAVYTIGGTTPSFTVTNVQISYAV